MDKNEMVSAARALVEHLEHDRLEDAQALAGKLDCEISQATPPAPAVSPEEKEWIAETLATADREAARNQT